MFSELTSKILIGLGIILILFGIIFSIWGEDLFNFNALAHTDKLGQVGDFVGGIIGSLWALAGVILFYVALQNQRRDIKLNREVLTTQVGALNKQIEEFELQRNELKLTREVFKKQGETLALQQFESTFFNMVNLHHQIVNTMTLQRTKVTTPFFAAGMGNDAELRARDCFTAFYSAFKSSFKIESIETDELKQINKNYSNFYKLYQPYLGHYFRNLYNILKFIDKKNPGDKFLYSNLLRAQLSSQELQLLFYNCLSQFGRGKFKPLIEKYHFLQNMPKKTLINKEDHIKLYDSSAFGRPEDNVEID